MHRRDLRRIRLHRGTCWCKLKAFEVLVFPFWDKWIDSSKGVKGIGISPPGQCNLTIVIITVMLSWFLVVRPFLGGIVLV